MEMTGTFIIDGNSILADPDNDDDQGMTFVLSGDTLTLTDVANPKEITILTKATASDIAGASDSCETIETIFAED